MENELEMVPSKLTKRLIRDADELIKEGLYANKSELIRDAVRPKPSALKRPSRKMLNGDCAANESGIKRRAADTLGRN